jgi:hypothetical protein
MAREVAGTWTAGTTSLPLRKQPAVLRLVPHRLTAAERHRRTCELAYRRAEQRDFAPGGELEDWLEAEREVDAGRY